MKNIAETGYIPGKKSGLENYQKYYFSLSKSNGTLIFSFGKQVTELELLPDIAIDIAVDIIKMATDIKQGDKQAGKL